MLIIKLTNIIENNMLNKLAGTYIISFRRNGNIHSEAFEEFITQLLVVLFNKDNVESRKEAVAQFKELTNN